jgi:hypothetical protein
MYTHTHTHTHTHSIVEPAKTRGYKRNNIFHIFQPQQSRHNVRVALIVSHFPTCLKMGNMYVFRIH